MSLSVIFFNAGFQIVMSRNFETGPDERLLEIVDKSTRKITRSD